MERVRFTNVTKTFPVKAGRKLLRGHMRGWLAPRESAFCALRDVSFVVREGESLGIVGGNGAGKSTLLNLATSLCYPDKGEVKVNGRLTAVLELGSGFHGDLTGAENLFVNAALFGLSRKRTLELFDAIVDFAGVADFINEPLRTYSTGMIMRLAFSVAIHADPDILVIDEVIAVGDQAFSEKCVKRILKFRHAGKTVMLVSHSLELLRLMCTRALWLDSGQVVAKGHVDEVLSAYQGRLLKPF
jgi:lipopolysaccharide transport system ATP-binding protein